MAVIDDAYNTLKYRATKAGYNGNISPNDFNLLWNRAEQRLFNAKYKQYLINQGNSDSMIVFKTDPLPIIIDVTGKYTKPVDVLHIDAIRSAAVNEPEIDRVEDDRLGNHLTSTFDQPTVDFPIYVEYKLYIQFYPISLSNAKLVYLKKLVPAKWAYTLVSGRPVYDNANSVQPLWRDNDIDEIIYMVGVDLGLSLRDPMVLQVNDVKAKENI